MTIENISGLIVVGSSLCERLFQHPVALGEFQDVLEQVEPDERLNRDVLSRKAATKAERTRREVVERMEWMRLTEFRVISALLCASPSDPECLRSEVIPGVPCRVIRGHVLGVALLETRLVDALTELLVAAGLETVVERADFVEHLASDCEGARRGELLVLEIRFDGERERLFVALPEVGLVVGDDLDVTSEVVVVVGLEGRDHVFDPRFGDPHIRVKKEEDISR